MKKEKITSLATIAVIILFSLGATYAFLNLSASNNTATGEAGCFEVSYTGGQEINNSSLYATETYSEGASTEITLSKAEDCEIYTEATISIYTNTTTTSPISNGALKYVVMTGTTTVSSGSITTTGQTDLATVTLTTTATTYKIYIWIDSTISYGTYDATSYSGYIYASSTQSSTITG